MTKTALPQVQVVNVKEIWIGSNWNMRSGDLTVDSDTDNSFSVLKNSIAEKGQDDPVDLMPIPKSMKGVPKGVKYLIIAGNRRCAAIEQLVKEKRSDGSVDSRIFTNYTLADARIRNISENCNREGVKPADTCFAIGQLIVELAKQKKKVTQTQIEVYTGISQATVSRYLTINQNVLPNILADWRTCLVNISLMQMLDISQLPKDKQRVAFDSLVKGKSGSDGETSKPSKVTSLCKQTEKLGELIGMIQKLDTFGAVRPDWGILRNKDTMYRLGVKIPQSLTEGQVNEILDSLEASYMKVVNEPLQPIDTIKRSKSGVITNPVVTDDEIDEIYGEDENEEEGEETGDNDDAVTELESESSDNMVSEVEKQISAE